MLLSLITFSFIDSWLRQMTFLSLHFRHHYWLSTLFSPLILLIDYAIIFIIDSADAISHFRRWILIFSYTHNRYAAISLRASSFETAADIYAIEGWDIYFHWHFRHFLIFRFLQAFACPGFLRMPHAFAAFLFEAISPIFASSPIFLRCFHCFLRQPVSLRYWFH